MATLTKTKEYLEERGNSHGSIIHRLREAYHYGYKVVVRADSHEEGLHHERELIGRIAQIPDIKRPLTLESPIMLCPSTKALPGIVEIELDEISRLYVIKTE